MTPEKLQHLRHSLAHLLAAAVGELHPDALRTIGPATDNGFYYDFDFVVPISESDLAPLEEKMREILGTWKHFARKEVTAEEARLMFADNPYKLELIEEIVASGEPITLYTSGEFTDLCKGGHVEDATEIPDDAFTLSHLAGAYWRGDEKNKMLTRIYGLAFSSKKELDNYRAMQEEAKKRDHRKLGAELDLFVVSELVGRGLPLFTPKGTVLRDEINNFSQGLRLERGFEKVWVPHITKSDLYKMSGHWDKFGHELFKVESQETNDEFVLKPMNCPHHQQIYASRPRSYRDLPVRYLETTTVYRDEKTGELGGLSRVRAITQDDSHVLCTPEQIEAEYQSIMEMVIIFYQTVGMAFRARLSFRDPKEPEKYLGEETLWEAAEQKLEDIAKRSSFDYFVAPGEAAFYGPKIDFMATDALGREHQLATAQLDFVQPARFNLEYTAADGSAKTPVMIHLAIAGSLERFLSVYIEHTAGAFPLWAAPVQARVMPIGKDHVAYARDLYQQLKTAHIRAELDDSDETLGKKIRAGKLQKIPYLLVIGEKEVEAKTATLEHRERGRVGTFAIEEIVAKFGKEIAERR